MESNEQEGGEKGNFGENFKSNIQKVFEKENFIELLVVILLGVTALLTAWASWVGSLHGGNQATNYAKSNNLASEGNSEYNSGIQFLMQDMLLVNEISSLLIDQHFAEQRRDRTAYDNLEWKIEQLSSNMSEELAEAFDWSIEQSELTNENVSPFDNEEFVSTYFVTANELLEEAAEVLEAGEKDGANADAYGLVTVFYTVALFLLGITSTFKDKKNKTAVMCISIGAFLIATFYMMFLPLPTSFNIFSFFGSR